MPTVTCMIATCRLSCPQALSPVGRCKTFEASGDGYGRGEGCVVAILQPAAGGDEALAVLHSTVVNQDGRSSSLTAPNGPSQTALVTTALQNIGKIVASGQPSLPCTKWLAVSAPHLCSFHSSGCPPPSLCRRSPRGSQLCGGARHRHPPGRPN